MSGSCSFGGGSAASPAAPAVRAGATAADAPPAPSLPRYGERALSDLSASLFAALDVPGFVDRLGIDPVERVCLLVVDGLGWELLVAHPDEAPFLFHSLVSAGQAITAGFPSTTVASLTSLGTALPPSLHGLVGYTIALPGEARALNCLRWAAYGIGRATDLRDRYPPESVQPEPTAFERAAADGVAVTLVGHGDYATSGFTRAALRGGRYEPSLSLGDQVSRTIRALGSSRRAFVYAYHPELDITAHVRGVHDDGWRLELAVVDRLAEAIAVRLPRGALLVVTGDHGMVDVPTGNRVDLADHSELADGVRLLAGEPRARHVHTSRGAAADVLATWRALLGDSMWVVEGERAVAEGWFGPDMPARVRPRIGDVVAAAFGPVGVVQREVDPGVARLIAHHGSMTPAEQLVPWLSVRS